MQTAAVIGERVEKLSKAVADMATDLREMDRRLSRLEGAYAVSSPAPPKRPTLPPSEESK